jgi:hypothetical protein
MNRAMLQHLIDQLRTGLIQPEELTEPEVSEVLAFRREQPGLVPGEVERRLRLTEVAGEGRAS